MASTGILGTVENTLGFGVADVFDLYKGINQVQIDKSFAKSQNYINELNAQAAVGRLQNLANMQAYETAPTNFDTKKMLGVALLVGAGLGAVYLLSR